jgi:hypothetical protein
MKTWLNLLLVTLLLVGCSTQQVETAATFPRDAGWALLPIVNQSQAPQAGERAEALVETELRVRGLHPEHYPVTRPRDPLALIDENQRFQSALQWARKRKLQYGITGSVQEWRYKSGLDGEPAAGISLRVIDVSSGKVLWAASGARTGWGYESLSGTAAKVIHKLMNGVAFAGSEQP